MEPFKLATVLVGEKPRAAIVLGDRILDMSGADQYYSEKMRRPRIFEGRRAVDMLGVLDDYERCLARLVEMLAAFAAHGVLAEGELPFRLDHARARLVAPVIFPGKILCVAANYSDHIAEMKAPAVDKAVTKPFFFPKLPTTCLIGPEDPIRIPVGCTQLDWEAELAVVIGRRCKRVRASQARAYVAGYTVMNDISARDWTYRPHSPFAYDWVAGKCADTFAPMGPFLVPAAFVPNPDNLDITLTVNGEVMQKSNTRHMIFKIEEQIEYLSQIMTLEPGDVISTGTPAGVGAPRNRFLRPGDVVVASVSEIGSLRNPVIGAEDVAVITHEEAGDEDEAPAR